MRCAATADRLTAARQKPGLSAETLLRSRAWVGNGQRLRGVARMLSQGKPLDVVVFGGSITLGARHTRPLLSLALACPPPRAARSLDERHAVMFAAHGVERGMWETGFPARLGTWLNDMFPARPFSNPLCSTLPPRVQLHAVGVTATAGRPLTAAATSALSRANLSLSLSPSLRVASPSQTSLGTACSTWAAGGRASAASRSA